MTPTSIIYVWKEGRPEKPVVATEIVKKYFCSKRIDHKNYFQYLPLRWARVKFL
jgi:hypothetical protein